MLNLRPHSTIPGALIPVGPAPYLRLPSGWQPFAAIAGNYLLTRGLDIAVATPAGKLSAPVTLPAAPLCAAIAGTTLIIMTPAGPSSYTLNPDTPALTPLAAPSATTLGIIARSAAPVSVDLPAVKTSQIPSAVIQAIYRLDDAVSAEGLQWQPVIAYITATTPTGNPIITTEPKLITAPDGIEFSGNIPLHSNDGDTTLATTLETPAWQLIVIGDNDLRAACPDAAITLNVATILPRFDLSRTPAVIPRRRADDSAFCTVTLAPSRFSAAARPGPGRQAAIASAIATFDSSGVPKSTPRSYTSVMLSPPHSFIARHAAVAPGIVLWSDPTVSRALPPCASTFAAATGSVAWHAAVKVTFADGSSLVTATEGLDNAPLSFGPILSYPAPDAVSIHIIVKATGHPVRSGTFPLSPDPSRRRAIYIHSTLTPFTLPDTPAAYTIPAQQPAAVHFPGTIAAAPASAPLAPASLATLPAINALAAPTASQTAWDYGRSRFYAFTASGIHLLNVDLTKPRISTSAIDRRVVAAPCAVACCDDNIAAIASSAVISISGARTSYIADAGTATALAWSSAHRELWLISADSTYIISPTTTHTYNLSDIFIPAATAGNLLLDPQGYCRLPDHNDAPGTVDIALTTSVTLPQPLINPGRLTVDAHGRFTPLTITVTRHGAPAPDTTVTLRGPLRSPVTRTLILPPSRRYTIALTATASTTTTLPPPPPPQP